MPDSKRGLPARALALLVLLAVAGALIAGAVATRHHHDGPGLYDDRCPLEALAAVDRTGGLITVATTTPIEVVAALLVLLLVARPALAPVADARLRAPPVR
jgi:hypothetical protein